MVTAGPCRQRPHSAGQVSWVGGGRAGVCACDAGARTSAARPSAWHPHLGQPRLNLHAGMPCRLDGRLQRRGVGDAVAVRVARLHAALPHRLVDLVPRADDHHQLDTQACACGRQAGSTRDQCHPALDALGMPRPPLAARGAGGRSAHRAAAPRLPAARAGCPSGPPPAQARMSTAAAVGCVRRPGRQQPSGSAACGAAPLASPGMASTKVRPRWPSM